MFLEAGYTRSQVDRAVYFRHQDDEHTVITVSVDDMAVTSKHLKHIVKFKDQLRKRFEITDLRELTWLIRLKIERNRAAHTITLSQTAYDETVVTRLRMQDTKSMQTPMEVRTTLSVDQCPGTHAELEDMRDMPYQ